MDTKSVTPISEVDAKRGGDFFRSLREMADLSQGQVTAKVAESIHGFNRPRLSMIECGHTEPSIEEAVAISSAILFLSQARVAKVLTAAYGFNGTRQAMSA